MHQPRALSPAALLLAVLLQVDASCQVGGPPSSDAIAGSWTFLYEVKIDDVGSELLVRSADAMREARDGVRREMVAGLVSQEEMSRSLAASGGKRGHSQVIKSTQVFKDRDYYWRQDIEGGWDKNTPGSCTWQILAIADYVVQRQCSRSTDAVFTLEKRKDGEGLTVQDQLLWDTWQEHSNLISYFRQRAPDRGTAIVDLLQAGAELPKGVPIPPNTAKIVWREQIDGDAVAIAVGFHDAKGGVAAEFLSQWVAGEPRFLRYRSFWLFTTAIYFDIQIRVIGRDRRAPLPTILDVAVHQFPEYQVVDLRGEEEKRFDPRDGVPKLILAGEDGVAADGEHEAGGWHVTATRAEKAPPKAASDIGAADSADQAPSLLWWALVPAVLAGLWFGYRRMSR